MLEPNLHILSTAALDKALIEEARGLGITIDCLSLVDTKPVTDPALRKSVQDLSGLTRFVVFTSVRAVNAVHESLGDKCPPWKVYATDGPTRELVSVRFGKGSVVASAINALSLANRIIADGVKEISFFCGSARRHELPDQLRKHHVGIQELIVYETLIATRAIEGNYGAILFFSPSAVKSYFSSNSPPGREVVLFAIGQTTAGALKNHCSNLVITGEAPGKERLVRLAFSYFLNRQPQGRIAK